MQEVLFTAEVVAGTCLLLVILLLSAIYLRRRHLERGGEVIVCSLRRSSQDRWRTGLLRLGDETLEWFPMFGVTILPGFRWGRRSLTLGNLAEWDRPGGSNPFPGAAVQVPLQWYDESGHTCYAELALPPEPYTAVRAWAEAAPPGAQPVT